MGRPGEHSATDTVIGGLERKNLCAHKNVMIFF